MPAPLVGLAVAAAARLAAKKLATKAVKKTVIKKIAMTPKQAALKKKATVKATDKASVKVVKPTDRFTRATRNIGNSVAKESTKSGERAKAAAQSREKAIAADRAMGLMPKPVKIKSGGDIKPATPKVTRANTSAGVGKAPSKADVKWDMEKAKLSAKKGKTVKINSK